MSPAGRESGAGLFSRDGGGEGRAARARGARIRALAGRPRLRRAARPRRPPRPPRLRRLPARAARARRGRARRPRLARRHAHRRRQEPLLPAPRPRLGQAHHRGQPADRADGRPVAAAHRRRPPGGDDRLGPPGGGGARRDGADPRRPGPDRLLLAGALRPARLHERGRPARGRPARRRRGPLHLRVGPRLPPRLPAAAAGARAARPPDGDGLHRDRDRGRLERDRPAPRPPRPADDPRGLRPPQPQLRHRPVRGQGIEGAQAGDAAPRPRATRPTARRSSTAGPARTPRRSPSPCARPA